jgi:3-hydroxyisobutyrate dehydrogenase
MDDSHLRKEGDMKVGFIGTGLMGKPMAGRLLDAGHTLTVYNRTAAKAEPLGARGASIVRQPHDVFSASEITILMLSDAGAIRSVLAGAEPLPGLRGRTVLQMSTIAPGESSDLMKLIQERGGEYLEAPVLGSTPQAEKGRLIVMVGATGQQFSRWHELLSLFGPEPVHVGEVGQAAAVKLALNQLIASLITAFAGSLGLIRRHRVPAETFMDILHRSVLHAATFDQKLPRLLEHRFSEPHFPVKHLHKDVLLIQREMQAMGLNPAAVEGVRSVIERAMEMGLDDLDYSALYEAVDPTE